MISGESYKDLNDKINANLAKMYHAHSFMPDDRCRFTGCTEVRSPADQGTEADWLDEIFSKYSVHRIGAHSDDWGGDSDKPCFCDLRAAIQSKVDRLVLEGQIRTLKGLPEWGEYNGSYRQE